MSLKKIQKVQLFVKYFETIDFEKREREKNKISFFGGM